MRFLLDENLGIKVQRFIQDSGYECIRASSILGQGVSDSKVYQCCLHNNTSLITRDHHFLNPLRFPPRANFGIILIRHGNLNTSEEIQLISNLLGTLKANNLYGNFVILSRSGISYLPVK